MSRYDLTKPCRRDNLPTDPDIAVGRIVETAVGRGSVAWIDWKKDLVHVHLFGADVVSRKVHYGLYNMKSAVVNTYEETVFKYDEVTATTKSAPTADDLEAFMAARSTGKPRVKRPSKPRVSLPKPATFDGNTLTIGEIVSSPDHKNPQLVISKGDTPKTVVVQDTTTGKVAFAEVKTAKRTGTNFTQLALV